MTTDTPTPTPTAPPRRVDGSMSLLVDMMNNTLDEAYVERAARRSADAERPLTPAERADGRRSGLAVLVGLVAVGLLTGTAIDAVRERQEATQGLRSGLADEVRDRTAESDELSARAADLRDRVAQVREQALGADAAGQAVAGRLEDLGVASATTPVRGPGLVVTLDDAPADEPDPDDPLRGGTVPEGRVQDRDLQDVVNGLWAAGAEAIAIDGQRLSALTAVRSAGDAVLVDLRPLTPPYVVEAVGDPQALELEFVDGPTGRRLTTFTSLYGIVFEVRRDDSLTLAGSSTPELRAATPAPRATS